MSVHFNRFLYFIPEEIIIKILHDKELKYLFYFMGVWREKKYLEISFLGKHKKT